MLASERRDLLLDIKDRLAGLNIQKDAAGKDGDWELADSIEKEISEVKAQSDTICDLDTY